MEAQRQRKIVCPRKIFLSINPTVRDKLRILHSPNRKGILNFTFFTDMRSFYPNACLCFNCVLFFQPYVSYIFYCFAGGLGLIAHYILPQLRKALPWLCCARPMLRSREYHLYEVRGVLVLPLITGDQHMYCAATV